MNRFRGNGFSLVELLLVLAIIGILSAIAIPALTGQRHYAKMIGVAQAQAQILAIQMTQNYSASATPGVYGPANATASWAYNSDTPTLTGFTTNPAPGFFPTSGNTGSNIRMEYSVTVGPTGLTYVLNVNDATSASKPLVLQQDQNGKILFKVVY